MRDHAGLLGVLMVVLSKVEGGRGISQCIFIDFLIKKKLLNSITHLNIFLTFACIKSMKKHAASVKEKTLAVLDSVNNCRNAFAR